MKNQASKVMLSCVEASDAENASYLFTLLNLYMNFVLNFVPAAMAMVPTHLRLKHQGGGKEGRYNKIVM